MSDPLDVVLLLAIPASGKSEVRRYLCSVTLQECIDQFHMGPTLQLDDYPYGAITDVLRDVCDRNGVGFRDLLEPLVGLDAYALRAHPHDHHPNARAHGLVAEWWSERLSPSIDCGETR